MTSAQAVNTAQQVTLAGLRANAGQGSFPGAAYAPDGTLYLLYNQGDGIRILSLDATGASIRAQTLLGAAGDNAVALAVDPSGNLYVTGTSSSGMLQGTSGTAFPTRADTSTNSFLAKFTPGLNLSFLTFLGAGRTSASSVTATADAAFVTGLTFNSSFPVTANAIQQAPAIGTFENGFAERFNLDGTLVYATYLTGAQGSTAPTVVAADTQDNAYVAGYTSAPGYPTVAGIIPQILGEESGFLTKLTPAGDGIVFSTFIPGTGVTGLAFDPATNQLLLTGTISPSSFPLAAAPAPLANTTYQSLIRIPPDGQSVTTSTYLVPGTSSAISTGPNGTAWITGQLSTPLFPGSSQPLALMGDVFALHLTSDNQIDQTLRFGGLPVGPVSTSTLTTQISAPAISPDGKTAAFPATLALTLSPSVASTQRFDLPTTQTPNPALPTTLRDLAGACTGSHQCFLTSGYLTLIAASTSPALSVSYDDAPNLTLRNLGSATAQGLALTASGPTISSNCEATLAPSNACNISLSGSGAGTFTASAANAPQETVPSPASTIAASPLAIFPAELDFGIQSAASPPATRTFTITNLSSTVQSFTSALDSAARTLPYTLTESATDCATSTPGTKTLTAGTSCHITLALSATSATAGDGPFRTAWKVGSVDVALTGITQTAALSVSSSRIDFGIAFAGTPRLPRYLFLSNNSTSAISHSSVSLPSTSPFSVVDECPASLAPHSVCRLTINYVATRAPSNDVITLTLDQSLTVLVVGSILPAQGTSGSSANPSLNVSPATIAFATPVVVSGISATTQTVSVRNAGITPIPLTLTISGDFTLQTGCPATLAGGASCQLLVSFAPSQPGVRNGLLSITSGTTFAPSYVSLSGTATSILPPNNGVLNLGQTLVNEPTVSWYKVQLPLSSITVTSNSPDFQLALVEDSGTGHGTLPPGAFSQTITGSCANCYLGVQFLTSTSGFEAATLSLSTVAKGNPYVVTVTGTALPVTGLLLTPVTNDFGSVSIHSTGAPQIFSLVNLVSPASALSITSVTASGDFAIVANPNGGQACSASVDTAATCFIAVAFSPKATGPRNGSLTVVTSAGSITAALTGYGSPDTGLALNPTELDFRNAPATAATQQIITLTNTGDTTLSIGPVTASDAAFIPSTACTSLAPAAICTISVIFQPGAAPVAATLSIPTTTTINGQATTTSYTLALNGLYTAEDAGLLILPSEINFGTTPVDTVGLTRLFTLTNLTAKPANITLSMPRQFPLVQSGVCPTLAPNASCTFAVQYLPAAAGAATGTIFAQGAPTDGSSPLQALGYAQGFGSSGNSLTITGNLTPHSPLNFGQPASGQTTQQTLTLTNSGTAPLTVRRILSDPPFNASADCGGVLAPNARCSITITYAPTYQVVPGATSALPRTDSGYLTIESDAASSPDIFALTGRVTASVSSSPASGAILATYNLSQGSLTFSNTQVGNISTAQNLTLTNTGSTTLHILGTIVPADFSATTDCDTLLPGDICTYTVSFRPGNAGTSTLRIGTLGIRSDAATPLDFVSLIGTSAAAQLTLSPTKLDFGTVNVGVSNALPVNVANTSAIPPNFTGLTATGDYVVTPGDCPGIGATLPANGSCTLQVTFTPTATGVRTGTLSLTTDATPAALTVSLTGKAVSSKLLITPGALAFATIPVGSTAQLSVTLTNSGTAAVNAITAGLSGPGVASFAITTPCPASLAPGQGCTLTVTYAPSVATTSNATLTIASTDPSSPATIPLTGTAVAPRLVITPASLVFGPLTVGTTAQRTITLVNAGMASVSSITAAISGPNASSFAVITPCAATLAPGASCTLTVSYAPSSASAESATLTLTSTDASSPATIPLSGSGIAAGSFTLTVNGSTSATATITHGSPATYSLSVSPVNGFSGSIALTCAALNPGTYAACSIDPSTVVLAGTSPQTSTATISTISHAALERTGRSLIFLALSGLPILLASRRRSPWLLAIILFTTTVALTGCGSHSGNAIDTGVRYTPAGTYQYQITATSTSGTKISQTVTLNLIVQ